MKLLPYVVGMNFGEGQDGQLYVLGLLAPSNELACAHAVSTVMQMAKVEKPLTRIIWQELEEAFLVEALKGLRGEAGGDTKVVSLRAVDPPGQGNMPTGESLAETLKGLRGNAAPQSRTLTSLNRIWEQPKPKSTRHGRDKR